jgi:hypothetical protein
MSLPCAQRPGQVRVHADGQPQQDQRAAGDSRGPLATRHQLFDEHHAVAGAGACQQERQRTSDPIRLAAAESS